jgi:hypothetical protein
MVKGRLRLLACIGHAVIDTAGLEAVDDRARPIKRAQSEPSDRKEHQRLSRASKIPQSFGGSIGSGAFCGS